MTTWTLALYKEVFFTLTLCENLLVHRKANVININLLSVVIGDAEMGNRLNRVVRGCLEADINPVECKYQILFKMLCSECVNSHYRQTSRYLVNIRDFEKNCLSPNGSSYNSPLLEISFSQLTK